MIDSRNPLFVTGCSRSGTTALVQLLNAHPAVVMGMERFKHVYSRREPGSLANLFTRDRFLDFRVTDTNITPAANPRWRRFYQRADKKLATERSEIIGDKALATPGILKFINGEYPGARWIFIFRDLIGVAGSYVKRAENPGDINWPESKRHREALGDWTRAFQAVDAIGAEVGSDRIFPVSYETLFAGDRASLKAMFGFLELAVPEVADAKFAQMTGNWDKRNRAESILTEEARKWLETNRCEELEQRYQDLAELAVERWR